MPLGKKVGLGPCHIVLDRDTSPLPKGAQQPPPLFLAHFCYGLLCLVVPSPSFSRCIWSLMSTFFLNIAFMVFLCGIIVSMSKIMHLGRSVVFLPLTTSELLYVIKHNCMFVSIYNTVNLIYSQFRDGVGNIVERNYSIFCVIWMH